MAEELCEEMRREGGPPTSVHRGFVPWDALAGPLAEVLDAPVAPLVGALNRTAWVRTVFSCAGHPEEADAVARGRRQAHVDALVADPARWRTLVRRVRRAARAAVEREGVPGAGVRCAEGSLGPPPDWLRAALAGRGEAQAGGAGEGAGPPWWRRLLPDAETAAAGPDGRRWRYRRLVLEPVPYDLAPVACRRVLDAALAGALEALLALEAGTDGL